MKFFPILPLLCQKCKTTAVRRRRLFCFFLTYDTYAVDTCDKLLLEQRIHTEDGGNEEQTARHCRSYRLFIGILHLAQAACDTVESNGQGIVLIEEHNRLIIVVPVPDDCEDGNGQENDARRRNNNL